MMTTNERKEPMDAGLKIGDPVRLVEVNPGICPECGQMRGRKGKVRMLGVPLPGLVRVEWEGCSRGHVFMLREVEKEGGAA
jgi:hypothetical protein